MKTFTPSAQNIERQWYVIDASGQTLGRLASNVAHVLKGKHKRTYSPHLDLGDFVIVINAEKIRVTGKKLTDKFYYRHSGYPGGLRTESMSELLSRRPERVVELAIKGMLPDNRLGDALFRKLKVYRGPHHPHQAQKPHELSDAAGYATITRAAKGN